MQQLTARLEDLDPDIGKAMKALVYFDKLIEGRGGIEGFVRGAAVLAGHTAGLSDPDRSIYMRVDPEGRRLAEKTTFDNRWPSYKLDPEWEARVWLETTALPDVVEETVIQRLILGARLVLDQTRGRLRTHDEATVEVLLDDAAPVDLRLKKAHSLGFTVEHRLRAIAVLESTGLAPDGQGLLVIKPHVTRMPQAQAFLVGSCGNGPGLRSSLTFTCATVN